MLTTIHLVTVANNEPFISTQSKLHNTIELHTKYNVKHHMFSFDYIKNHKYFDLIKLLPNLNKRGRRDGYYNIYKVICYNDVMDIAEENDIIYYVDSSQYYQYGFLYNIDKLMNYCYNDANLIVGSYADNSKNSTDNACDQESIWNLLAPSVNYDKVINKRHILTSWFLCKKNNFTYNFFKEVFNGSININTPDLTPAITYHHTVEQAIINIIAHKYPDKCTVFYVNSLQHCDNKDRNLVLQFINSVSENNINDLFHLLSTN
jgi:hypothetical protein